MMCDEIAARYRWTFEELQLANTYHFRHTCRPTFRFGLNAIFAFALAGGLSIVVVNARGDREGLLTGAVCTLVGIYWFVLRRIERRWWRRRQFDKRPDRDVEVEWRITGDQLHVSSPLGTSKLSWSSFAKVVFTPEGVLLYPINQVFHWLPRSGFASGSDFDSFVQMATSRIEKHTSVA